MGHKVERYYIRDSETNELWCLNNDGLYGERKPANKSK